LFKTKQLFNKKRLKIFALSMLEKIFFDKKNRGEIVAHIVMRPI